MGGNVSFVRPASGDEDASVTISLTSDSKVRCLFLAKTKEAAQRFITPIYKLDGGEFKLATISFSLSSGTEVAIPCLPTSLNFG